MYFYVKALHIIFVVTWFSGLFYVVRLFIYNTEAEEKPEPEKSILHAQLNLMMRRLWYGITWPSAVLTLIFGLWMLYLYHALPGWLVTKLFFVLGLYFYHFSLQVVINKQLKGQFPYSSTQLRMWNEVATIFLVAIVLLVVVKDNLSFIYGMLGLGLFILVLMAAIFIYKRLRNQKQA
jgi:protoporphyrinogen IX oxidase